MFHLKYSFSSNLTLMNNLPNLDRSTMAIYGRSGMFANKFAFPVVYIITKEVFDNFTEFKRRHPAFRDLTKEDMLEGLTAPLHPGAAKYFKEAGLLY